MRQFHVVVLVCLANFIGRSTPAYAAPIDGFFWQAVCSTGAIVACASVMVRKVWTSPRHNDVQVLIRNLQGQSPADNTGGSVFDYFQLGTPNTPNDPFLCCDVPIPGMLGVVGLIGGPAPWGYADGSTGPYGFFLSALDLVNDRMPGSGIIGCDPGPQRGLTPYGAWPMATLSTCAPQGYSGWATITTNYWHSLPYDWDIAGANFTIGGYTANGNAFSLGMGAADAVVLPEPSSFFLLGSGAIVLALSGGLRRRGSRTWQNRGSWRPKTARLLGSDGAAC